jgi:hypothetical protein
MLSRAAELLNPIQTDFWCRRSAVSAEKRKLFQILIYSNPAQITKAYGWRTTRIAKTRRMQLDSVRTRTGVLTTWRLQSHWSEELIAKYRYKRARRPDTAGCRHLYPPLVAHPAKCLQPSMQMSQRSNFVMSIGLTARIRKYRKYPGKSGVCGLSHTKL